MGFPLLSMDLWPLGRGKKVPVSFKLGGSKGPSQAQPSPAQPREYPVAVTVCNVSVP